MRPISTGAPNGVRGPWADYDRRQPPSTLVTRPAFASRGIRRDGESAPCVNRDDRLDEPSTLPAKPCLTSSAESRSASPVRRRPGARGTRRAWKRDPASHIPVFGMGSDSLTVPSVLQVLLHVAQVLTSLPPMQARPMLKSTKSLLFNHHEGHHYVVRSSRR